MILHTNRFAVARKKQFYARLYGYIIWAIFVAAGVGYVAFFANSENIKDNKHLDKAVNQHVN